jgi:hypothetical protein
MANADDQVRVVRERGRVHRVNVRHDVKQHATVKIPAEVSGKREIIRERYAQEEGLQQRNFGRRAAFRRVVTEESLRRRRTAAGEQSREQFAADVFQKSGGRPATVGAGAGVLRTTAIIFLMAMLFLIVSRGSQSGTAINKVGYFLNNVTSNQPLFKKKAS